MKASKLCNALKTRTNDYLELCNKIHNDASADTIHDFRVASRYLLAIEPLVATATDTTGWRKRVKHWLKSFTHLRDLHVFRKRFSNNVDIRVALDALIENELMKLESTQRKTGTGDFGENLRQTLETFCNTPHKKKKLDMLMHELWRPCWKTVSEKLDVIDYNDPASIHRLRIAFKPFRYTANFLHEAKLVEISTFDQFRYWQDLMGDINDLEAVTAWLAGLGNHEILIGELREEAAELRQTLGEEEVMLRSFINNINKTVNTALGYSH